MLAAGPAAHLVALVAVLGLWFAAGWDQPEHFTAPSALAVGFFACNFYLFFLNLIPRNTAWNGTSVRTDGGNLLDLFRGNRSPQSLEILISLADEGKWNEVQAIARASLRQQPPPPPSILFVIHAWLAVADVWVGGEDDLKEADTLSQSCMQSSPGEPATLAVRACVLMAHHRDDEAEKLLTLAAKQNLNPYAEKAAAHLWTELHRRRNNLDQMHHWQTIAQKLDPTAAYKMFRDPTPTPAPPPS